MVDSVLLLIDAVDDTANAFCNAKAAALGLKPT
jgi:hypothetical protein